MATTKTTKTAQTRKKTKTAQTTKTVQATKATKKERFWNDVQGKMILFANSYNERLLYSSTLRTREDDEYIRTYVPIKFVNCEAPDEEGMFNINVKSGFWSFYNSERTGVRLEVIVTDYEYIEE